MIRKLSYLIDKCKEDVHNKSCENCCCNERACLLNLIETYNKLYTEDKITIDDIDN